jgi:predicted DNA-binding protein (MmcQ/YjbR family)
MDYAAARKYLLDKREAVEDHPFGPDTAVYFIRRKMFATLGTLAGTGRMNLKCDPDEALALRDIFSGVIPGYHMNKKHWNTVILDGSVPRSEIERMIDNSYHLVIMGMPAKNRPLIKDL